MCIFLSLEWDVLMSDIQMWRNKLQRASERASECALIRVPREASCGQWRWPCGSNWGLLTDDSIVFLTASSATINRAERVENYQHESISSKNLIWACDAASYPLTQNHYFLFTKYKQLVNANSSHMCTSTCNLCSHPTPPKHTHPHTPSLPSLCSPLISPFNHVPSALSYFRHQMALELKAWEETFGPQNSLYICRRAHLHLALHNTAKIRWEKYQYFNGLALQKKTWVDINLVQCFK